jgi:hypothetical protein
MPKGLKLDVRNRLLSNEATILEESEELRRDDRLVQVRDRHEYFVCVRRDIRGNFYEAMERVYMAMECPGDTDPAKKTKSSRMDAEERIEEHLMSVFDGAPERREHHRVLGVDRAEKGGTVAQVRKDGRVKGTETVGPRAAAGVVSVQPPARIASTTYFTWLAISMALPSSPGSISAVSPG